MAVDLLHFNKVTVQYNSIHRKRDRDAYKNTFQLRHTLSCECDDGRYPDVRVKAGGCLLKEDPECPCVIL